MTTKPNTSAMHFFRAQLAKSLRGYAAELKSCEGPRTRGFVDGLMTGKLRAASMCGAISFAGYLALTDLQHRIQDSVK